jgi:hypothetical protein
MYVKYRDKWEKDKNNDTLISTTIRQFIQTIKTSCNKYRDNNHDLPFKVFQDIIKGMCDGTLASKFRNGIFLKQIADNTQLFKDKNMDIIT